MFRCLSKITSSFKIVSLVTVLFLFTSCKVCEIVPCNLTKSLWFSSYEDTFKYFLISQDGKLVVFLGNKYHYVLQDSSNVMQNLLTWQGRDLLYINTKESKLHLDLNNDLRGYITIETFYAKISRSSYRYLRSLGFKRKDQYNPMKFELKVLGKRYLPRRDLGYNIPSFKRKYTMDIYYDSEGVAKIGKVALTPVTVAADATIVIGNILLFPFRGQ